MIDIKTWDEFRKTGLFQLINSLLHAFGWAIVLQLDNDGNVTSVYPAKVGFRGFSESDTQEMYENISAHLKEENSSIGVKSMDEFKSDLQRSLPE